MENSKYKLCKHYTMGHCKNGDLCTYEHIDNVCRDYFKGNCERGNECKFKHIVNNSNLKTNNSNVSNRDLNNHKKKSKSYEIQKNTESFEPWYDPTESFEPWYDPADMRIMFGDSSKSTYNNQIMSRDIIIIPNLFLDMGDIYNKIIKSKTTVNIPLTNGSTCAFSKDINIQ